MLLQETKGDQKSFPPNIETRRHTMARGSGRRKPAGARSSTMGRKDKKKKSGRRK
jgi:hypothetical protein